MRESSSASMVLGILGLTFSTGQTTETLGLSTPSARMRPTELSMIFFFCSKVGAMSRAASTTPNSLW